ncbi:MAG: glycosyltransferase family 4 protein [bacterium]|nr:glycosyltransferase family 4 protein [bacterium]
MKKVLLVTRPICPPWDEASKNFAYYLAQNIKNFEVSLLTNRILPGLPENIHQKPIYTSSGFSYFQKLRLIKHLRKMRNDFDIIHYLFTPTKQNSFLIKKFAQSKRAKSIQTIATLREDLFSDADLKSTLFADLIITYSEYSKNKLEALGFENVKRIYPGIDTTLYSPAPKNPEFMKKNKISPNDFVINFAGEYTRLGAIDDVIDSFVEVSRRIPEVKLSLAVRIKNEKDAQKKKEVMEKLKQNNILNKVFFHDKESGGEYKMPDIYNLCDVSLFPARDMNGKFDVPLAVIEAMSCEKPVIISDLPILQEFANEQNSVTIKAGDIEKLSEKILDIYNNKEKYAEIGRNAGKFVEQNFDIRKVAEKYEEVYQ